MSIVPFSSAAETMTALLITLATKGQDQEGIYCELCAARGESPLRGSTN